MMRVKIYRRVISLLGIVIVAVLPCSFVSVAIAKKEKHIGKVKQELVSGTVISPADQRRNDMVTVSSDCSTSLLRNSWMITDVPNSEPPLPESTALPGSTLLTSFIYGIGCDGRLIWYRHNGASNGAGLETPGSWQGGRPVGRGWGEVAHVFPGGGNIIYVITQDGTLNWYRHNGFNSGLGLESAGSWAGPRNVGRGWSGNADVFSGSDGVIYLVKPDGTLVWYRHLAYQTGEGLETPGAWAGPRNVGRGWSGYKHIFSAGEGVIYTIAQDGKLNWYRHKAYLTGAGLETPGAWEGGKEVGRGWGDVQQVFSSGNGIIYAVKPDGKLWWYRHYGYLRGEGLETPGAWADGKEVGTGWAFTNVFALLP